MRPSLPFVLVLGLLLVAGSISDADAAQAPTTGRSQSVAAARVRTPATRASARKPAAAMTNASVIRMVKAGLSQEIIATSIRGTADKKFDLSPDGLIALMEAGVPDEVILVMQGLEPPEVAVAADPKALPAAAPAVAGAADTRLAGGAAGEGAGPAISAAVVVPGEVLAAHEPGIYAVVDDRLEPLTQAVSTAGSVGAGSLLASGFTFGLKKAKMKAEIRGARARIRIPAESVFYFYGSAFDPNTFVIAKVEPNKSQRKVVIGEGGLLGVRSGLREKDQVAFEASRLQGGIYRVSATLLPGEYVFIEATDIKTAKLWDFGVN
jgi:hypothetical protein